MKLGTRIFLISSVLLLTVFLAGAFQYAQFRWSDQEFIANLTTRLPGYHYSISYDSSQTVKVRSIRIDGSERKVLVLIHGSPSSSQFWEPFLFDSLLLKEASMVAVDRPGYGYSNFGEPMVSVKNQAKHIYPILAKLNEEFEQVYLLGSSYGGTVAARLLMDYPDIADGVVFMSSSLKTGAEKIYWVSYPIRHWLVNWSMPETLNVANAEKLSHHQSLKAMEPLWTRIKAKISVIHGSSDQLIYPENASFVKKIIPKELLVNYRLIENRGHDLFWTEREAVKEEVLRMLEIDQPHPMVANQTSLEMH